MNLETLRVWQRLYVIDTGLKSGFTTDRAEENWRLRREIAEVKKGT
ncbi:hypothetical protein [Bowdeniella nasicola]|nr:hypothetical protein [Bowdeniella nasicola]